MFRFAYVDGRSRRTLAAGLALALTAAAPALAQRAAAGADSGFGGLAGSWSGNGTISTASGNSERIRCRVNYAVGAGGNSVHQDLRCASDSYNFQVASDIVNQGGAISGTWTEVTRGVTGNVSGRMSGGGIQLSVTGPAFTAGLSISTSGNRQTVMIRPSGGDIRDVSVSLSKGR